MKSRSWFWIASFLVLIGVSTAVLITGCQQGTSPTSDSRKGAEKKSDEDLIKAQAYCPIQKTNKLGSMGKPYKVMVKDEPVFLCCESCKDEALANPEKTLSTVKELRNKNQK